MFSALACVAFAFSGFASNEVITEETVQCKWRTVIVVDGIKYYSDWTYGECWDIATTDGTVVLVPIKDKNYLSPR